MIFYLSIYKLFSNTVVSMKTINNVLQRQWTCDGVLDCSNGEDEEGCPLTCDATQFLCKAKSVSSNTTFPSSVTHDLGFCISKKHQCDGLPDCPLEEGKFSLLDSF